MFWRGSNAKNLAWRSFDAKHSFDPSILLNHVDLLRIDVKSDCLWNNPTRHSGEN